MKSSPFPGTARVYPVLTICLILWNFTPLKSQDWAKTNIKTFSGLICVILVILL